MNDIFFAFNLLVALQIVIVLGVIALIGIVILAIKEYQKEKSFKNKKG